MTTYRYKGQTKDGTAVSGVIRAYDEFEAASRLRETVAIITRLEEVREKKENIFNRPIGLKIKEKELALICSQFAIILSAGMSIQHCVEMVAAQTRNHHIRQMLEKVAEEVGAGYSMAQSFENNAPYLPKTFIETSGPENSPARWRSASSGCTGTMINPPRPRPRWSAP